MNRRMYNPKKDGIKIKTINITMFVLIFIICAGVFISAFQLKSKYSDIITSMEEYARCTQAVNNFRDSSDFLTNQVRLFIIKQDEAFAYEYIHEYSHSKNRDLSLDLISSFHDSDDAELNMKLAFEESQTLAQTELYSMALVYDVLSLPSYSVPAEISTIKLLPDDHLLSDSEKLKKAEELLFNLSYQDSKNRINKYTTSVLEFLLKNHLEQQALDTKRFYTMLAIQILTVIALFASGLILFFATNILILKPIDYDIKSISQEKKMHVVGSYEMRLIAKSYNALREKDEIKASVLKHKAEHDPLTGLINREAFGQIKEVLCDTAEPVAYLIIDIDFFKSVNDKYGHLAGDNVLRKISAILSEQFRNTDYVARIGGDEFAVIMTKFGETPEMVIQRKIETINKMLQNVGDGLPGVSLSVGVAISNMGYIQNLESQADKALYRVKQGGRCNCSFYTVESA